MKRILCLALVVLMMCAMLAACGSFTCDVCKETRTSHKNSKTIDGETLVYCDDCKEAVDALQQIADSLNALGDL